MLLIAWTVMAVAGAVILGSSLATPSCAHLVSPPPSCAAAIAAENDRVWATQTLPLILVLLAGYAVIVFIGLGRARRRGSRDIHQR
jgi:hypothetical protein